MFMNSILATGAVVLGLGIAPALAAGPLSPEATGASFAALSGVTAEAMSAAEMAAVEGQGFSLFTPSRLSSSGGGFTTLSLTEKKLATSTSSDLDIGGTTVPPHPKWNINNPSPGGHFIGWSAP